MSLSLSVNIKSPASWFLGLDRLFPSIIPEVLYDMEITTLTFTNETQLSEKLNQLLQSYNKGAMFTFPFLATLSIQTNPEIMSTEGIVNCTLETIKKYKFISRVEMNGLFLTAPQQEQLEKISEYSKLKIQHHRSHLKYSIFFGAFLFVLGTSLLAAVTATPIGLSFLLPNTLYASIMAGLFSHVRQAYLDWAARKFDTSSIDDGTSENQSFKYGSEAANWKGYLLSYTHLSTYTHPVAFAAGMKHKTETNYTNEDAMPRLRVQV